MLADKGSESGESLPVDPSLPGTLQAGGGQDRSGGNPQRINTFETPTPHPARTPP